MKRPDPKSMTTQELLEYIEVLEELREVKKAEAKQQAEAYTTQKLGVPGHLKATVGREPRGLPRPAEHVASFRSRRPDVFKLVDPLRARRASAVPPWPEWCFMTIPAAIHLLNEDLPTSPEQLDDVLELAAFAPWRLTQGIYRLAPAVLEEALNADPDMTISAELLMRLPQWCVYVETPGWRPYDMRAAGFFAHLVPDGDRPQMRMLWDLDDTPESRRLFGEPGAGGRTAGRPRLLPQAIDLTASDPGEAASMLAYGATEVSEQYWDMPAPEELAEAARGVGVDYLAAQLAVPIAALTHICSPAAEYRDAEGRVRRPTNPEPKKTRRGLRLFPPQHPTVWEVH